MAQYSNMGNLTANSLQTQMNYNTAGSGENSSHMIPHNNEHLGLLLNQSCEQNCQMIDDGNIQNQSAGNLLERCRFCGIELIANAAVFAEHFNSHYRQFNLENLNTSCSYEHSNSSMENRLNSSVQFLPHHQNNAMNNHAHNHISNLIQNNIIGNNGISTNNTAEFQYNYSPQSEPSNLTSNHIRSHTDSTEQSLRIDNLSCNSIKDNSNEINCNQAFISSNHRASPLNLTGRSKISSSPVFNRNISTSSDQNGVTGIEDNGCVIQADALSHPDDNAVHDSQQSMMSSNLNNDNSHQLQYPSNFTPNNYYQNTYSFNNHQPITHDLPSCRLQNFNGNLDAVGLTIPVLSPTFGSIHQDDSGDLSIDRTQQNNSLAQTENLSSQCSHQNSPSHTNVITHTPDYPHNYSPIINVSDCEQPSNETSSISNVENIPHFHCVLCQKSFSNKLMFNNHMSEHSMVKSHSCVVDSLSNNNVKNEYVSDVPYTNSNTNLPSCSMRNEQNSLLKEELKTAKPYQCSICNKEFEIKEDLHKHINDHEASKPFHCDICGLGVSNQRALKRHRLIHSGNKPHKCTVCGKSFLQRHDLNRHGNIHLKPKCYTCEQCKRTFSLLSSLSSHKCKSSKESKPFLCRICGEGCTNRLAWSYHMWKHTKNPKFVPFQEQISPVETS